MKFLKVIDPTMLQKQAKQKNELPELVGFSFLNS